MKTLQDIATEEEISYLIKSGLITAEYREEIPVEVREITEQETEIHYKSGLIVTIYDAVEPTASWG